MSSDRLDAFWRAIKGVLDPVRVGPTYLVIPIQRTEAGSLETGEPIKVDSALAAIEIAGSMLPKYAGTMAVAFIEGVATVLARYGETSGKDHELK
jgi:hypothetical protein